MGYGTIIGDQESNSANPKRRKRQLILLIAAILALVLIALAVMAAWAPPLSPAERAIMHANDLAPHGWTAQDARGIPLGGFNNQTSEAANECYISNATEDLLAAGRLIIFQSSSDARSAFASIVDDPAAWGIDPSKMHDLEFMDKAVIINWSDAKQSVMALRGNALSWIDFTTVFHPMPREELREWAIWGATVQLGKLALTGVLSQ